MAAILRCVESGPMQAIVLDGATLTPAAVARVARDGAPVELHPAARERNESARRAVKAVLARGDELYGASTGVGPLRAYRVDEGDRREHQIGLLRSHACGAGRELPEELVRAAMATRANQLGAGGRASPASSSTRWWARSTAGSSLSRVSSARSGPAT